MAIIGNFGSAPDFSSMGYQSFGITVRGTEEDVLRMFHSGDVVLVSGGQINNGPEWEFYPMVRREPQSTLLDEMKLCFLDLETGGLHGRLSDGRIGARDYPILEIGMHVTDTNLDIIGEGFRVVVHHDEDTLAKMDPWAISQHTKSGLLDEVRNSPVSLEQAQALCLAYLASCNAMPYDRAAKTGTLMCGNSIRLDREYLDYQMPELSQYFHYRQIDWSAINLACRMWAPSVNGLVKKKYRHLALADIVECIDEARIYKNMLF